MDAVYERLENIIRRIKGDNDVDFSENIDSDLLGKEFRFTDIDFVYFILETQREFGVAFSEEELLREDSRTIRAFADAVISKTKDVSGDGI